MGLFHHHSHNAKAYEEVINVSEGHKAKLSHELIAAAASYEAAKAYEQHKAKHGNPSSHAKAKQLLAAFTGAAVDRLVETKGLNAIDKHKAKKHAEEAANKALDESGEY